MEDGLPLKKVNRIKEFEVYLNEYDDYYDSKDPVLVTIPFSSFVGRDDKNSFFSPTQIQSFGLWSNAIVPAGEDASTYKLDSALYYDSIKSDFLKWRLTSYFF